MDAIQMRISSSRLTTILSLFVCRSSVYAERSGFAKENYAVGRVVSYDCLDQDWETKATGNTAVALRRPDQNTVGLLCLSPFERFSLKNRLFSYRALAKIRL